MKAERLILSVVAIVIGLAVAGLAFYLYQMSTKEEPLPTKLSSEVTPTPTPDESLFITLDSPKDEEVVSSKTLKISGKTTQGAIVVVNTESNDEVVQPAANGSFSLTQTIDDGVNLIQITAIFPNGEERTLRKTVTYSAERF